MDISTPINPKKTLLNKALVRESCGTWLLAIISLARNWQNTQLKVTAKLSSHINRAIE